MSTQPTMEERTEKFFSVVPQVNLTATTSTESPVRHVVHLKEGFHYESFNPNGNLQAWNILKMVEFVRIVAWSKPQESQFKSFLEIPRLFFTAAADLNVSRELYDPSVLKGPVTAEFVINYIGRTSFKSEVSLYLQDLRAPVAVSNSQFVLVDPDTRTPSPPDPAWRESYSPLMPPDAEPLRIPALSIPKDTPVWEDEVRVQPSDLDFYHHLNWTNPSKMCVNAITLHFAKEQGDLQGDPYRNVKTFGCNYRGEASMGDVLRIKFWRCAEEGDKFCYMFYKKEAVVLECIVVFYPKET